MLSNTHNTFSTIPLISLLWIFATWCHQVVVPVSKIIKWVVIELTLRIHFHLANSEWISLNLFLIIFLFCH